MGEFAQQLNGVVSLVARAAAEQGGVISGDNPTHYNASNPFRLWVIQVVIIIGFSQLLALGLGRIRQPRVIAEVIGGILLGPTVMGRIPNFKNTIFPDNSMPLLNLTSTVGLILFLFLVALEIDTRLLKRSIKVSAAVSVLGLVIPLGMGAALGVGVYKEFIDPNVNFGYFLLFTAVAIGITAFPVLCRILTELKLLETQVGVVVLSAGIGNDVVGWILLALTVALVNASTGLTALYVLLASAGYTIFLLFPVKWAFHWLARRTGSLEQGTPTPFMMTVTLLVVFVSAFFTDIIGVHAIFGGFLAGLIIPHDNGFAISLVEKIEDLVTILFIPIYFTLSGLRTNLGLLDNGITWGYVILICLVALFSKFVPCAGAAYYFGFPWREAGAIGALMSCKGLVELIVLNIGLQAGILDARTFSMFVVHALVLTFITTPLTLLFYPAKYRHPTAIRGARRGAQPDPESHDEKREGVDSDIRTRFAIVLDKIEQLSPAMTISQLLNTESGVSEVTSLSTLPAETKEKEVSTTSSDSKRGITIDALRLIELTNRTSAVIKSQEADALIYNDPVISVYSTFGSLNHLNVSASLSVVPFDEFPDTITQHVANSDSDMLIIPWARGTTSILSSESDDAVLHQTRNPFDHKTTTQDQTGSAVYGEFIRSIFLRSSKDVAVFVDRGVSVGSASARGSQHLFLPFFGGPDDRLALTFLVQLASRSSVKATVVRIQKSGDDADQESIVDAKVDHTTLPGAAGHLTLAAADTVYGAFNTQTRLASDTADNLIWEKYTNPSSHSLSPAIRTALGRVSFTSTSSAKPLHTAVELIKAEVTAASSTEASAASRSFIALLGRSRRMAVEPLGAELRTLLTSLGSHLGSSVPKTLGDVGAALVASNVDASLLVLQAASTSSA
ncbi:potassium:hydrogen antiporter [Ephemerocybe angulata]|uniref:Potassium:hydrogen antiporter n=1 Tax=Ephemerocybe angulata TaxID=980116 RepID=A0A8H6HF59_9AGAR|nr:potassium:hydrogen antiporter [Tulosesus angulatus]KAF6745397.1 potassium:hydrogen antiporter [Tulosesus angulatus]